MANQDQKGKWLSSKEAIKHLKISGCELMHRRERGELKFEKRGRAYFYYIEIKDQ
ncbi:hypothetical protein NQT69_12580 [Pseudoalteromonas shioyasakiensis]|uniref:hypothetical protein n=1 Tax=Pseudoalteromonas shioyasakiensis TaxID=1190813 RepID=UPI0021187DF8|nr:hypothetical protein [Pseudoalteromonas shioyasakiensis]MCQ8878840.1 hypothetical protein [Pseudoalteromonas shioyasakiensis]